MIVKTSSLPEWISNPKESFERKPIAQNAISSFQDSVIKQALKMRDDGLSDSDIALKFNLPVDYLSQLINTVKIACSCQDETVSNDDSEAYHKLQEHKRITEAEKAYEDMYGKKKSTDDIHVRHAKSVLPSIAHNISDNGGSNNQIKFKSSNTILDPNALERLSQEKGNDEKLKEEIQANKEYKEKLRNASRYESLKDYLDKADTTKGISVQNTGLNSKVASNNKNYYSKLPANSISMFDENAAENTFNRIPETTSGERLAESKNKEKDRSWLSNGKSLTSKDIYASMLKNLIKE